MDIRQSDTLQKNSAREEKDERHICPLQLEVIRRCIELWTNPNDIVFEPFGGIGSVPYVARTLGRRAIASELKESYYKQMVLNVANAETSDAVGYVGSQITFDFYGKEAE
jgi:DNA modification methylase